MKQSNRTSIDALYAMLLSKQNIRFQPTLQPMKRAYAALSEYLFFLGLSQPHYIQVLGTNGKGSTSTYITNLGIAHNLHVGLFISPHLVSIRERIIINGELCTEEEWIHSSETIEHVCNTSELLFFEYVFLMALYIFSYRNMDIAVIEAGLGGKYDATSVVNHCVQCFTPIQLDHEHILGRTYGAIAHQKGAAIQKRSVVLSAPQREDVRRVLFQYAHQGVEFCEPTIHYTLSLQGKHQEVNASLAYIAWLHICKLLCIECKDIYVEKAYKESYIPGRIEEIPLVGGISLILDGAHNCGGLETLYEYCKQKDIIGVLYSTVYRESIKDTVRWVRMIAGKADIYYYSMNVQRAVSYQDIVKYDRSYIHCTSIQETVAKLCLGHIEGNILLCGSLYFVGTFFREFPEYYRFKIKNT